MGPDEKNSSWNARCRNCCTGLVLEDGIANVEILTVWTEMSMIKILHYFVMQLIMAQIINGSFGKTFSAAGMGI
jgi:hypothetical protein